MATRKIRKPRAGEYFVFHDDPKYVVEIFQVYHDGLDYFYCHLGKGSMHTDSIEHFVEFHTRVPI